MASNKVYNSKHVQFQVEARIVRKTPCMLTTLHCSNVHVALPQKIVMGIANAEQHCSKAIYVAESQPCCFAGLLVLRTMASTATFALATALTARTDSAHAAAHQICLQLWLASSLLADSLAVAAQTLLARSIAARNAATSQLIAKRVLKWGVLLGFVLAGALAASSGILPKLFTSDPAVLAAITPIYPWVILTQPINALAFVWDGVLYGCNGFKYAAKAMTVCAAPAASCMLLGLEFTGDFDAQLISVWLGLALLMVMRCLTIYIPYRLRRSPFDVMFLKQDTA